ncbi:MAG: hypothetical protein ABI780_03005 [Ardenticatenales bacterium]
MLPRTDLPTDKPRRPARGRIRAFVAAGALLLLALPVLAHAQPTAPPSDATASPEGATPPPGEPIAVAAAHPLGLVAPDSEVVFGPTLYGFDLEAFVAASGGYLAGYAETVDGETLSGAALVDRVAHAYGVGPRVLLALIELKSGWLSQARPSEMSYPLGGAVPGLYNGLIAAADDLNEAYYARRGGTMDTLLLADGRTVRVGPEVNAGSFAVLTFLSRDVAAADWSSLAEPSRFWAVWTALFGDEPLYFNSSPVQPQTALPPFDLRLPFADGTLWYFVQGPASPRGRGGPRAAVAFAPPPAGAAGCAPSGEWVAAAADGQVVWSDALSVVVDADTDAFLGSGWSVTYEHLAPQDRVAVSTTVRAGDPIGHPSCAGGGPSTQVSLARRFNGEWVGADRSDAPLVLDGWAVLPGAAAGEGVLIRSGEAARQAGADKVDARNAIIAPVGGR